MKNFGINQVGIPKYQTGTPEKGIQLQYNGPQYYEVQEQIKKEDPYAYNRLQIQAAKSKSPHSEIVRYEDANGNWRTATTGAGALSGTDPIGSLVVENAVLNKPLGYIINRLGQFGKLLTMNKTYTGVPQNKLVRGTNKTMAENFPEYEGTVWTTSNKDYARTFDGERDVFKVFGPNKGLMDTPKPEKGHYFGWDILPFKLKNFKVIKVPGKTQKRWMSKVDNKGNEYTTTSTLEYPDYIDLSQWKEAMKIGVRTDDVVNWSKDLGYDGIKFHQIHDGTIWKKELPVDEPIEEIVYNSGKNLIKVPENVSDWDASKFVDFTFGNKIAPIISTSHNIKSNK